MKTSILLEAFNIINEAQEKILEFRETIEEDTANTASQWDNTNKAFEHLNSARIYTKEAINP